MFNWIEKWFRTGFGLGVAAGIVTSVAGADAPPRVDWIFPAGGPVGSALTVRVGIDPAPAPLAVWCEDSGVRFGPVGTNGECAVVLATNAVPGAHWLRFFNTQGASAPRLFVAGDTLEIVEDETTNAPPPAIQEWFPVVLNGRLREPTKPDVWRIRTGTNEIVHARLDTVGLDLPLRASLAMIDESGETLGSSTQPPGEDASLSVAVHRPGIWRVEVRPAPTAISTNASEPALDAVYRLRIHKEFAATPNDSLDALSVQAGPRIQRSVAKTPWITFPSELHGWIDPAGDEDTFSFHARFGETYFFRVRAGSIGSPLPAEVRVLDDRGTVLASSSGSDPELSWTASGDGLFVIGVTGEGGRGGFDCYYRLELGAPQPHLDVEFSPHTVVLEAGNAAEMRLRIRRPAGFDPLLLLIVEGLPAGVTALTTPVPPHVDDVRFSLVAGPDAPAANQPGRIVVRTFDLVPLMTPAQAAVTGRHTAPGGLLRNTTEHFWLTVRPKPAAE